MKKWLAVWAVVLGVLGLTGCNTMEGFGKDFGKLGDKIENSADRHK